MSRSVDMVVDVLGYFVGEPSQRLEVSSTRSRPARYFITIGMICSVYSGSTPSVNSRCHHCACPSHSDCGFPSECAMSLVCPMDALPELSSVDQLPISDKTLPVNALSDAAVQTLPLP